MNLTLKSTGLSSIYRKTAHFEIKAMLNGRFLLAEAARFTPMDPTSSEVFYQWLPNNGVSEISQEQFLLLVKEIATALGAVPA
jgi:hypothetical protein